MYTPKLTVAVGGHCVGQERHLEHPLQQQQALPPPQPRHALDQVLLLGVGAIGLAPLVVVTTTAAATAAVVE